MMTLFGGNIGKTNKTSTPKSEPSSPAAAFAKLKVKRTIAKPQKKKEATVKDILQAYDMLLRKGTEGVLSTREQKALEHIEKRIPQILGKGSFKGKELSAKDKN